MRHIITKSRMLFLLTTFTSLIFLTACSKQDTQQSVTVYVSEDQIFSEPILKDFEKETGIRVDAVYDTEEAKSTGAMNRLIAERDNPRADVYWANEPIRAEVLRQKGLCAPYYSINAKEIPMAFKDHRGHWTGFSARARVLAISRKVIEPPRTILAYTDPKWKGQSVIANPLFGTTTSHISALFTLWGEKKAKAFMTGLKKNGVAIATSNGESADFVANGKYDFALVDSDDAVNRMRQKKDIIMIYPDQEENGLGCFIVPNAVMLIKNAPHPKTGKKLIDYLLSRETERKLAFADCAQIPLHHGVEIPAELKPIDTLKIMKVDYAKVAKKMVEIQPYLKQWLGL